MGNKDGKSVKRFLSNIYPVDKLGNNGRICAKKALVAFVGQALPPKRFKALVRVIGIILPMRISI